MIHNPPRSISGKTALVVILATIESDMHRMTDLRDIPLESIMNHTDLGDTTAKMIKLRSKAGLQLLYELRTYQGSYCRGSYYRSRRTVIYHDIPLALIDIYLDDRTSTSIPSVKWLCEALKIESMADFDGFMNPLKQILEEYDGLTKKTLSFFKQYMAEGYRYGRVRYSE